MSPLWSQLETSGGHHKSSGGAGQLGLMCFSAAQLNLLQLSLKQEDILFKVIPVKINMCANKPQQPQ